MCLADLSRIKLVGLSKKIPNAIPKTVERLVTVGKRSIEDALDKSEEAMDRTGQIDKGT